MPTISCFFDRKLNYLSAPACVVRQRADRCYAQAGKIQISITETNRFEICLFEFGVCLLFGACNLIYRNFHFKPFGVKSLDFYCICSGGFPAPARTALSGWRKTGQAGKPPHTTDSIPIKRSYNHLFVSKPSGAQGPLRNGVLLAGGQWTWKAEAIPLHPAKRGTVSNCSPLIIISSLCLG